jgi:SagB-type dehydrogenase family enzyme
VNDMHIFGMVAAGHFARDQTACNLTHINVRAAIAWHQWSGGNLRPPTYPGDSMNDIALNLEAEVLDLPPRGAGGGHTLQQLLQARHSTRDFHSGALTLQQVGDVLWSAFGVNRPHTQQRTAPSAHNWREITLHVLLPEGAYRYDAVRHKLQLIRSGDLRALSGLQEFPATAPLNLVYVADFDLMLEARQEERFTLAAADAGCIAQNVYLHCADVGLGTVVRALIDRRALAGALKLRLGERVILAQSVGRAKPPIATA